MPNTLHKKLARQMNTTRRRRISDKARSAISDKARRRISDKARRAISDKARSAISDRIRSYTSSDVERDYARLVEIGCLAKRKSARVLTGNKVVDKYTFGERLRTRGNKGISFYDLWSDRARYADKPYVRNFLDFTRRAKPGIPAEKLWYELSRFYFGSVQIFKPLLAMEYYCRYNPRCVLDPTMGWGGRLVGACAIGVPKYIGIDLNARLRAPYGLLTRFLKSRPNMRTEIDLRFQDALTVDYGKLDYDMVLTSPPYYNLEIYDGGKTELTKEEWDRDFYAPLFSATYRNLKPGGYYVLNIPTEVYERVCVGVMGRRADRVFPLKKGTRQPGKAPNNRENVYVWVRGIA